jgi:outer membrane protein assembly factor BamB
MRILPPIDTESPFVDELDDPYANASIEWIDAQLKEAGIAPDSTIETVLALVNENPDAFSPRSSAMNGWLRLAAGLLISMMLAPMTTSSRHDSSSRRVPPPKPLAISITAEGSSNEWLTYRASLTMSGVATGEHEISTATVHALHVCWSRQLNGPVSSEPSVGRGKVYIGDWAGKEWALDADTGDVIATADLGQTKSVNCKPPTLGIASSAAIVENTVYLAGGDDAFYALDAETLRTVWRRLLGDNSATGGYYGWSSPAVAGGKVLQSIASNCDNPLPRGTIVALDPITGIELASSYFVAWMSPAVDTEQGKIYVSTGSAHAFDDGDSFSIVRLSLDTLALEDSWQLPAGLDAMWDGDWGSSPTLFTDAHGRDLIGVGEKDGGYYAFNRHDLAAGPIWITSISLPGNVPENGERTLSTAAFDGKTLYIGGGTPPGIYDSSTFGAVSAVDPTTGKILWRHTFGESVLAPVSFANGVIFAVAGKTIVALDAANGALLWSDTMKGRGVGGVAIARGHVYVGDLSGTIYAWSIHTPGSALRLPRVDTVGIGSRALRICDKSDKLASPPVREVRTPTRVVAECPEILVDR